MDKRHFIFDIDGTLINTEKAIIKGLQELLLEVKGVPYEPERITSSVYAMATEPIAYSLLALDKQRGKATDAVSKHRSLFTQQYLTPARQLVEKLIANPSLATDELICRTAGITPQELAKARQIEAERNAPKGMMAMMMAASAKNENADKTLNLIIKCDVQGSIEAIKGLLEKINIEGTNINIIGARVGGITNNDIILAVASKAIIVGFNVRPTSQISDFAKEQGVEIRLYNIIYKLQEDIERAVKGLLDPVFEEKITGQAEVRELFKVSRIGTIAGSYVTSGTIFRNGGVRLIRDSIVIYTGKMAGLRRFKDDVKEVKAGYECGITIENYNDIKVGDIIECFVMEEAERE